MSALQVRNFDNAIGLEGVETNAAEATVSEIVYPEIFSVVDAVGFRRCGVMRIAPRAARRLELLSPRIVGVHRISVRRARLEHGNFTNEAARWNADDEDRATLAAGQKSIVLVEFTRSDVHLLGRGRARRARRPNCSAAGHLHGRGCDDGRRPDEKKCIPLHIFSPFTQPQGFRACEDAGRSCCTASSNRTCIVRAHRCGTSLIAAIRRLRR